MVTSQPLKTIKIMNEPSKTAEFLAWLFAPWLRCRKLEQDVKFYERKNEELKQLNDMQSAFIDKQWEDIQHGYRRFDAVYHRAKTLKSQLKQPNPKLP